jgi:hypothetical protein
MQRLQRAETENEVLRRAVTAFTMREAHIAEIFQGVRKCPECFAYIGPNFREEAQPCEMFQYWSKRIEAAHALIAEKAG